MYGFKPMLRLTSVFNSVLNSSFKPKTYFLGTL